MDALGFIRWNWMPMLSLLNSAHIQLEKWPLPIPLLRDGGHPASVQKSLNTPFCLSPFNFYLFFFLFLFTSSSPTLPHPIPLQQHELLFSSSVPGCCFPGSCRGFRKRGFFLTISSLNIFFMERNTGTFWPAALSIPVHNLLCILLLDSTWHSDALSTETIYRVEQQR